MKISNNYNKRMEN